MAYWINKKGGDSAQKAPKAGGQKGGKEEKKGQQVKRIDNLRVSQKLRIRLRSLGAPQEYTFVTRDLSATGVFVVCPRIDQYPFQPSSTLLEAFLELKGDQGDMETVSFLARIARMVQESPVSAGAGGAPARGFGLRIVQISQDHRQTLETFITKHGSAPDPLAVEMGQAV